MATFDLFHKRDKSLPDVFTYDVLPNELRVQIVHIWRKALGVGDLRGYAPHPSHEAWDAIHDVMINELGVFYLVQHQEGSAACANFLLQQQDVRKCLSLVELTYRVINRVVRNNWGRQAWENENLQLTPDEAVADLNHRFREHGVGYQFEADANQLIKLTDAYTHAEIVKPTLALLADKRFEHAQQEFLEGHEHYRHGRNAPALVSALASFESTMKVICHERTWQYSQNDQAKKLISTVLDNGLLPQWQGEQLRGLTNVLESGTPTTRNKLGGHGQGTVPANVPDHVAAYALHTAAANITLLVNAFKALQ